MRFCVQHDDIGDEEIAEIVDSFPGQTIDFFGALRARVYDDRVRQFVSDTGIENIGKRLVNNREKVSRLAASFFQIISHMPW